MLAFINILLITSTIGATTQLSTNTTQLAIWSPTYQQILAKEYDVVYEECPAVDDVQLVPYVSIDAPIVPLAPVAPQSTAEPEYALNIAGFVIQMLLVLMAIWLITLDMDQEVPQQTVYLLHKAKEVKMTPLVGRPVLSVVYKKKKTEECSTEC